MIFVLWTIGAMFTDGLKDPLNTGGFREGLKRFFEWPWELGQFVHVYLNRTVHVYIDSSTPAPDNTPSRP